MYRQNENPFKLERQLEELQAKYQKAVTENADEQTLIDISLDIAELKDRINFAWQDDEFDI